MGFAYSTVALDAETIAAVAAALGASVAGPDRELASYPFLVATAFTGAAVGDALLGIRVINTSTGQPVIEGNTLWVNETQQTTLASPPDFSKLTPVGIVGLSAAQLAAMFLNTATPSDLIAVTPVLDTAIYAAGDTLFDRTVIANAVRANGERALLQAVTLIDKDDLGVAMDLFLIEANVAFGTVNAAPSISDTNAEAVHHIASVAASDWIDLGGVRVATPTIKPVLAKAGAGSRDLYIAAITRGTPTHTASGLVVKVGLVQL